MRLISHANQGLTFVEKYLNRDYQPCLWHMTEKGLNQSPVRIEKRLAEVAYQIDYTRPDYFSDTFFRSLRHPAKCNAQLIVYQFFMENFGADMQDSR